VTLPRAYYNECDPKAAVWLKELIHEGLIVGGHVDERSITDVTAADLEGFTQCHFFAGIGGWPWALRLARWPDSRPVWTGSCPCQPFSQAGKSKGFADERHLWPAWFDLIEVCRPPVLFGEQVASPDGLAWFDLVSADLESAGYACGAFDLCAAGAGAPHIRQRLYFVADAHAARPQGWGIAGDGADQRTSGQAGVDDGMEHPEGDGRKQRGTPSSGGSAAVRCGDGFWADAIYIPCTDGKARPVEPGTFPLAHGVPGRVGLLRGYGNAIVPQVAQSLIEAYLDLNR
jgi:DNA (cytosine-5)-methyltransferase 1